MALFTQVRKNDVEQEFELLLRALALGRERAVDDLDPPLNALCSDAAQVVCRQHDLTVVIVSIKMVMISNRDRTVRAYVVP